MKKLFLSLVVMALAIPAFAQVPTFFQNSALTSVAYATGVTNLASPVFMDVRKQGNISLSVTLKASAATTNIYLFGWSDDGSTYSTNAPDIAPWLTDSISTLNSVRSTNMTTGGHGYLVLFLVSTTLQNTNSLKYTTKISAP